MSTEAEPMRSVAWFTCDCTYISSYCEDYHKAYASIPVAILDRYEIERFDGEVS